MITLVLGGTRSGKSTVAERLAGPGPVTYLATAYVDPTDADHKARIEAHRARRSVSWTTVECRSAADLVRLLQDTEGTILVDSIGSWIAAHADMTRVDGRALVAALSGRRGDTIVVSEEVGLSIHAPTESGRQFTDAIGTLNQAISAVADRAVLVIAGRVVELPPPPTGSAPC